MFWIALSGVEHPGNLGAVARVMSNFGYRRLLLLDPRCTPADEEARKRAKHATPILEKARIAPRDALHSFDLVIGTTAKLGTDYNLPRSPLLPEELAEKLASSNLKRKQVVLLFGPEGQGLSNKQLLACDFVITIPSSRTYPTLNLSHAVAVLLYELSHEKHGKVIQDKYPQAGKREKEIALELIEGIIPHLEFSRGLKEETQRRVWKRLLGKAMLTRREIAALLGFLRRTKKKVSGK